MIPLKSFDRFIFVLYAAWTINIFSDVDGLTTSNERGMYPIFIIH